MVKFQPCSDYIIIERAVQAKGIVLPDKAEPVSDDVFYVVSVGPGTKDDPQRCKPKDLICLVGYINTFSYKGEKVILARSRDVVCKIEEEKNE
jgi:co-chaperonin GroES (HSP10)